MRDALLGRAVTDADLATIFLPAEVIARAEAAGLKTAPTGIEHGTVTVIADGQPFEVTTLRRDVETDGRHAIVHFTTDWKEDAARRDFTMNALYCDIAGEVLDPLGGIADLKAGRVRFIGSAEDRIREDYLRILRFFRFFAWYGKGRPDADGAQGLRAAEGRARDAFGRARLGGAEAASSRRPIPARALLWMRTDRGAAEGAAGKLGDRRHPPPGRGRSAGGLAARSAAPARIDPAAAPRADRRARRAAAAFARRGGAASRLGRRAGARPGDAGG